MPRLKTLLVLPVCFLFGGCFPTALLYDNADWLIREKIDDYFSLSDMQEQRLGQDIAIFFDWHRSYELPEYARIISEFSAEFADGLTEQEVASLFSEIINLRKRFGESSLPSASRLLVTLIDRQLDYFDREFHQKLNEDREVLELSLEEQAERRFTKLLDTLEDWTGGFSEAQRKKLRAVSDLRPGDYNLRLSHREQRHRQLLEFLRGNPDEAEIESYLRSQYVMRQTDGRSIEVRQPSQSYWISAILTIDQFLAAEQRNRVVARLDEFRSDFIQLSLQDNQDLSLPVEERR